MSWEHPLLTVGKKAGIPALYICKKLDLAKNQWTGKGAPASEEIEDPDKTVTSVW